MTKKEAIKALILALAGSDADIPDGSTADLIAFLSECLSVDDGAVQFAVPED